MRIGAGTGFAIITGATIVSILIIASLGAAFIRETSGIEERWGTRTLAERDADITDPAGKLTDIPDETTDFISPRITGPGDHDNDGLPNSTETGTGIFDPNNPNDTGTDPTNPDTDGDGVADGIEIILGTDPTDPNSGGLPTVTRPGEEPRPAIRYVYSITKQARLVPNGAYTHYVNTFADGETVVEFKVDVSVGVTGLDETFNNLPGKLATYIVDDSLPRGLALVPNSFYLIDSRNGQRQTIPGWLGGYRIDIYSSNPIVQLTLGFSATVEEPGLWENIARVRLENFPLEGDTDKAIVLGREVES